MAHKPVNSLNYQLIHELKTAVTDANSSSCSSIILSSSCRVFSAGLDLNSLSGQSEDSLRKFWTEFQDLCFTLYGSEKFVVAEIGGHAPAGGTIISMCCDIRVATPGSKFGLNESAFGLVVPIWACDMMRDLIGTRLSYLSLCQGTLFTAEEAQELGLIDLIVEPNELQAAAEEQCQRWTQFPGRGGNKTTLRKANLTRWIQERGDDLDSFVNIVDSPVTQQRIAAYLQSLKK
jgi:Delta3-Delta2-enoyl-CoA isomerase